MNRRPYVVTVKGRIITNSGYHCAQGWLAGGIASFSDHFDENEFPAQDFQFDEASNTIEGDLILDDNIRLIPYATYYAQGGIADFTSCDFPDFNVGITCLPGYYPAVAYYNRTISEISDLLSIQLESAADEAYLRGLYVSVFGAFELFLRDFLLCGIFNFDECYSRAADYYHFNGSYDKLEEDICNDINLYTFHNFKQVKKLFQLFLDMDIPENGQLSGMLDARHNIVHRYAYSKKDGMQKINLSRDDVRKLILECNKFKEGLFSSINKS